MKKRAAKRWIGKHEKPMTAAQLKKIAAGMQRDIREAEKVIVNELEKRGVTGDELRFF